MNDQADLAGQSHWDDIYEKYSALPTEWKPTSYTDLILDYALSKQIEKYQPRTILEIGCGGSMWLAYLAKKYNLIATGIDYSQAGCNLLQNQLNAMEINGKVICADIFQTNYNPVGQFDFVYSLGVIEHFSNTMHVVEHFSQFVKSNGVLFTEIPNFLSYQGILCWWHQPELFYKHKVLSLSTLMKIYRKLNFKNIKKEHLGVFALDMVSWGKYPRFKRISRYTLPYIMRIVIRLDIFLRSRKWRKGIAGLSSYVYICGQKLA